MDDKVMPVLFVGHGSPMITLEDNPYKDGWVELSKKLPKPKAILGISAHWMTRGLYVNDESEPEQIYDFAGFPKELYEMIYRPMGSPGLAAKVKTELNIESDNHWGIDHGMWAVLRHLYPNQNVPVTMLSIDATKSYEEQYKLGKALQFLRDEGVLIVASGNVVHNLRRMDPDRGYDPLPFSKEFDDFIEEKVVHNDHQAILNHGFTPAVPTKEHFIPLLIALGASNLIDQIEVINKGYDLGSISMTSYLFYRK
ncbi:4,5-DOPA-extradiol-dioxygenase [Guggenheimella bovis]